MRHARSDTLDELEPLLGALRAVPGLVERSRGVFYRRSRAYLHFHEDPTGIYADLRHGDDFDRMPVNSPEERDRLLARVAAGQPGSAE